MKNEIIELCRYCGDPKACKRIFYDKRGTSHVRGHCRKCESRLASKRVSPSKSSWLKMLDRCLNPNADNYDRYGGRGIKICDGWREFDQFLLEMHERPSGKHQLDRINSNGNYEPSNCRWATTSDQSRNKRTSRSFTINGRTMVLTDWCEERGIPRATVYNRLKRGLTIIEALGL